MLLWSGFALLTAIVVTALAWPLMRVRSGESAGASADVEVYKDQLREIEAEQERGLLEKGEADAARTELARRLLRAAEVSAPVASQQGSSSKWATLASAALIPLVAVGVYLKVGNPALPGLPHADRLAASKGERSITDLVGLVEKRLRDHPEDGQGWSVIAPVYMKQQRYLDAARAYANAIRFLGETPDRVAGLAEGLVLGNNGLIVPEARKAYERLRTLQPDRPEPTFWLALAKEQDGDVGGARTDLEAMLKGAPQDAPWRPLVEQKLAELSGSGVKQGTAAKDDAADGRSAGTAASRGPSGPSAADVSAASEMTPEQRSAMIERMVSGLAERLERNGRDLEGWKRLVQAYKVMGREVDAAQAIAKARGQFAGDEAALKSLDELARALGLKS